MRNKLQTGYRRGQSHPKAHLSDHEIELIRELHEKHGLGWKRLAAKFEVARETVRDICNYKRRALVGGA